MSPSLCESTTVHGVSRMPNYEPLWSTFLPVGHAVWGMTKVRATELQESACLSEG